METRKESEEETFAFLPTLCELLQFAEQGKREEVDKRADELSSKFADAFRLLESWDGLDNSMEQQKATLAQRRNELAAKKAQLQTYVSSVNSLLEQLPTNECSDDSSQVE
jgi:vacuolar-type H+-ATPase subunit E/Vma4